MTELARYKCTWVNQLSLDIKTEYIQQNAKVDLTDAASAISCPAMIAQQLCSQSIPIAINTCHNLFLIYKGQYSFLKIHPDLSSVLIKIEEVIKDKHYIYAQLFPKLKFLGNNGDIALSHFTTNYSFTILNKDLSIYHERIRTSILYLIFTYFAVIDSENYSENSWPDINIQNAVSKSYQKYRTMLWGYWIREDWVDNSFDVKPVIKDIENRLSKFRINFAVKSFE
ncbi:MAG: hypothetical protein C0391_03640 [Anaerolinea sp.]|nr:hypothetical protein [Anaerolinea sp.]